MKWGKGEMEAKTSGVTPKKSKQQRTQLAPGPHVIETNPSARDKEQIGRCRTKNITDRTAKKNDYSATTKQPGTV